MPRAEQPRYITAILKDYQMEGVAWLKYMYLNKVSSILGDEMVGDIIHETAAGDGWCGRD